ncbi:unnamed protein product [Linum trigynum]|uniref:Uncharacterized protein n=1 Tax=Linum trigynum TaxID=586398 RepID=A0AAV2E6Q6_9ROSI
MDPEKLEPGNATDSESSVTSFDVDSVTSEQSSAYSSSRTPSSIMEFESIDSRRAKQKQQSTVSDDAATTSSPNYMKTTTSYVAKKSSSSNSQRSGGGSVTRRGSFTKPAKGLAKIIIGRVENGNGCQFDTASVC